MHAAPRHLAAPRPPILRGTESATEPATTPGTSPATTPGTSPGVSPGVSPGRFRHIPELDGIRALAVLAVFGSHVGFGAAAGGWIGVSVFFVLSGYLITSILIREWQSQGGIRLGRFYGKRLLRLYPALVLLLVLCAFFAPMFGDGGTTGGYLITALNSGLYIQNLVLGLTGDPHGMFLHTWSLAVEEQFYLIWPAVLIVLLRRGRSPLTWALSGTAVSWTLLVLTTRTDGQDAPPTYSLPHTRAGELLLGCALAAWFASGRGVALARLHPRVRALLVPGGLAALALIMLTAGEAGLSPLMPVQIIATALASAVLIAGLTQARPDQKQGGVSRLPGRALGWRPLVWLGTVSYGFYLFHLPLLMLMERYAPGPWAARTALAFVASIALAAASYRFVEKPFLRLKDRLA